MSNYKVIYLLQLGLHISGLSFLLFSLYHKHWAWNSNWKSSNPNQEIPWQNFWFCYFHTGIRKAKSYIKTIFIICVLKGRKKGRSTYHHLFFFLKNPPIYYEVQNSELLKILNQEKFRKTYFLKFFLTVSIFKSQDTQCFIAIVPSFFFTAFILSNNSVNFFLLRETSACDTLLTDF